MTKQKQLPIGLSTLEEIINSDLLYIDKTEIVHRLITTNRRCFFSRPRRFGKSLLVSTLKEIFKGNKALFKNVWIGQENRYDWVERSVIHLDFSKINVTTVQSFEKSLNWTLNKLGRDHGIDLTEAPSADDKINELISVLGLKAKVAVLIDEYDRPLLKHLGDDETTTTIRDMLSSFYATIKGLDEYIHFTFVTGVTKFAKTSLFSGPNNLQDISLREEFSALCGYTETEITTHFADYLEDLAYAEEISLIEAMITMRVWYNGYRFSRDVTEKIYNPFSVMLALGQKKISFYAQPSPEGYGGQPSLSQNNSFAGLPAEAQKSEGWFISGTPTFLIKMIQKNFYDFSLIDHAFFDNSMLDTFEIDSIPLVSLLYQTGYLTIEDYDRQTTLYKLTYPNEEVRRSLNHSLVKAALNLKNTSTVLKANALNDALLANDMSWFCETLQSLFSHIPYQLHLKKESFYHALLQMICNLLGLPAISELSVAEGRIDMVLQNYSALYIFEFKLDASPAKALEQIHEKGYYKKYRSDTREICLVGLNFSYETKTITHVVEKLER